MTDLPRFQKGDELWFLYFDLSGPKYVARCAGKVDRVHPELGYRVRNEWYGFSLWPMFNSKQAAEDYAREHPPAAPTIT